MPKVSPEHLAGRRRQILDAALECFAAKSFHTTSMQDICAASGLSPGAVYRYFRGKDEIIQAIAEEAFPSLLHAVEAALQAEPPPRVEDVVGDVLTQVAQVQGIIQKRRVVVQVWGEALRNPPVGAMMRRFIAAMRDGLAELVRRGQARGEIDPELDAAAMGAALFSLFPGFVLQSAAFPDTDPDVYRQAARALVAGRLRQPRPAEAQG